jgi:hypothetical protein
MMDRKLRKQAGKDCPLAERRFFSPKYTVPQYRSHDYASLDAVNQTEFDRCVRYSLGEFDHRNEAAFLSFVSTFRSLEFGRATFYLERELPGPPGLEWSRHTDLKIAEAVRLQIIDTVPDPVDIYFDWRPSVENGRLLFQTQIMRGACSSRIDFEVDLPKLREAELQQLADFLSRQHSGLVNGYEMTRAIVWLLDLSLQQRDTPPDLLDSTVRELLLSFT